jgi:hypothetical protein
VLPSTWIDAIEKAIRMSGKDDDLSDLLGPEPEKVPEAPSKPASRPMGKASRAVLERSRSINLIPRKNTPERLRQILKCATEMPVANSICMRSGISVTTLKYWLQKSKDGGPGDGYDIIPTAEGDEPIPIRFHEAFDAAIEGGLQLVEAAAFQRAIGFREVLTFQGRVVYQKDPELVALGFDGPEAYLLDEFGAPIPETVLRQDPDLMMFIMERRMKDKYGKNSQVDVNVKGGVLVVGVRAESSEDLNTIEENFRMSNRPAVTFEEGEDS